MQASELISLIKQQLPADEVQASGEGCNFELLVVAAAFENMNTVKRQQAVYGLLNDFIASGELHAVTMRTLTPAQWQASQQSEN